MKKCFYAIGVLAGLFAGALPLLAQHEHGAPHQQAQVKLEKMESPLTKVQGEIICIGCYLRHNAIGPDHAQCVTHCSTLSMPLGLLEDKTHRVLAVLPTGHADPRKAVGAYLGKKVAVEGTIYTMGGLAALEVNKIGEVSP